jgi:PBS lyase HEAT-like repeat-containing protein
MTSNTYPPPVDQLLTFGEYQRLAEWPNYMELGLGPEHTPDLIRMAVDEELNRAESDGLEMWAPVHAWRALGQLHAEAAIEPLISLFRTIDEEDNQWADEELPIVFGLIGPAAMPALTAYLDDPANGLYARIAAVSSLRRIAEVHPETRAECVAILTHRLEEGAAADPTLNGFLLASLLDLKAVESLPVMERAFAANWVNESIAGDWEDVQIEFGLKEQRDTPRRPLWGPLPPAERGFGISNVLAHQHKAKMKARTKRKQEKKSRRKNRKRK